MRCDDVTRVLPETVDGSVPVDLRVQRHIESCLRCQAEVTRYRRMLRGLHDLRGQYVEPPPALLAQTFAALDEMGEQRAVRSLLSRRRFAAYGGAAMAAGAAATTVVLIARSRRRSALRLAS
jgi:anti-sigma factor RsiW